MRRRFDRHGRSSSQPQINLPAEKVEVDHSYDYDEDDDFPPVEELAVESENALIGLILSARLFSSSAPITRDALDDAEVEAEKDYETLAERVDAVHGKDPETSEAAGRAYKALLTAVTDHCLKMFPA